MPVDADLQVVERGGCDVSPVDVTTEDGRLTLTSYVWPDMTARHARLAGAISLARERPVPVERADAASYVERLTTMPGRLTVLWHSVMWQYVPVPQQERVSARLEEIGRTASDGGAARAPVRRAEPAARGGAAPVLGVGPDLARPGRAGGAGADGGARSASGLGVTESSARPSTPALRWPCAQSRAMTT